eukprot:13311880-Alexandrium_andersonii.AAC.1
MPKADMESTGLGDCTPVLTSAMPNMQTCFRRAELEPCGPRSGLNCFPLQGLVWGFGVILRTE